MTSSERVPSERLVQAIENNLFWMKPRPGVVEPLEFDGVRGRRTPLATPMTNLVGASGPGASIGERAVNQVFDAFGDQMFGWLIGPNSPNDLSGRLQARGMKCVEQFVGLALHDLDGELPAVPGTRVREIDASERSTFSELLARAFGLPRELSEFMCEHVYFGPLGARNYFGFVEGSDAPVGIGSSLYDPVAPILLLAGSAVLEAQRGRGVYRALVRRRFLDARADGMRAAAIQAMRQTSAPICKNLGFEVVCEQELYARQAQGGG